LCLGRAVAGRAPRWPRTARLTLDDVNRMDEAAFVQAFGDVYELSPWVARAPYAKRPFATVTALHPGFVDAFAAAPRERSSSSCTTLSISATSRPGPRP
jgi:hypothetical protein